MLADMGFVFKEEIVWNKTQNTSPTTPINRVHETISIYAKKTGTIKLSYIPYIEIKQDIASMKADIKRILSTINNVKEFEELLHYISTGEAVFQDRNKTQGNSTTVQNAMRQQSRGVKVMQSIRRGYKEKSIIDINRQHLATIHPTQKPVRLLERLLALTTKEGDTVLDPFFGSGSCGEACINKKLKFIGFEIDEEYFNDGSKRVLDAKKTKEEKEKIESRQTNLF